MTTKPFNIYKSSAGSGKTYTLSKNYIRLALKSKNNYKKILAVTFTNKAAEEMKSRILQMIHQIANGQEKDLIILRVRKNLHHVDNLYRRMLCYQSSNQKKEILNSKSKKLCA